jgi:hypothetical protein
MVDITWKLSVEFPQLHQFEQGLILIGAKIVAELQEIQEAINLLVTNQAAGQEALAAHLTAIEEEIRQLGQSPSQGDVEHLAEQVRAAAATAAKGAEDLRAMTQQVQGMVPDAPGPPA